MQRLLLPLVCVLSCWPVFADAAGTANSVENAELGGPAQPVAVDAPAIDMNAHDGGLRPAIGVETIQVLRANREHPEMSDGYGWTYNHESMLAYWNGLFWYEYLSNPFGENLAPGRTLLMTSRDGRTWSFPKEAFPVLMFKAGSVNTPEAGMATMHQDQGFYVAPDGRMLLCAFYGHAPVQAGAGGIGRVVREIHKDGSFGPIYYVRFNVQSKYDEDNALDFPFYTKSPDAGFVADCKALLADPFVTMQWWGEDGDRTTGFFSPPGHDAASVFHRKDGAAVVFWKDAWTALSTDEGKAWSKPVRAPGLITDGGKTWGQRTKDGLYAMVYNPVKDSDHRWPIAIATSEDGIRFGHLLVLDGDISPRRYFGRSKDLGIMYMKGICEGNGIPPDDDMWVAYENCKEDLWINRIPLPIRYKVEGPVHDDFDKLDIGGPVPDWNIRRGKWTPVGIAVSPGTKGRSLQLEQRDPYDYATAMRVFQESKAAHVSFRLYTSTPRTDHLEVEILDGAGHRPVRLVLGAEGRMTATDGAKTVDAGKYKAGAWQRFELDVDAGAGKYSVSVDGKPVLSQAAFAEPASTVERLSFRTGEYRTWPTRQMGRYDDPRDLPGAGEQTPAAIYDIADVSVR